MYIVTTQFDGPSKCNFKLLLNVYRKSIEKVMPDADYVELIIDAPPKEQGIKYGMIANSVKLKTWIDFLEDCNDNVIFTDCDMLMLQRADKAFYPDFDVAYTTRTRSNLIPVNSGVVMVKPTEKAKSFMREWLRINDEMFKDQNFHQKWRAKYQGINQAAFGYLLETGGYEAKLHEYSTREWNAVECDWQRISTKTVFLHIKGSLRDSVLAQRIPTGPKAEAMKLWYNIAEIKPLHRSNSNASVNRENVMNLLSKRKTAKIKSTLQEVVWQ